MKSISQQTNEIIIDFLHQHLLRKYLTAMHRPRRRGYLRSWNRKWNRLCLSFAKLPPLAFSYIGRFSKAFLNFQSAAAGYIWMHFQNGKYLFHKETNESQKNKHWSQMIIFHRCALWRVWKDPPNASIPFSPICTWPPPALTWLPPQYKVQLTVSTVVWLLQLLGTPTTSMVMVALLVSDKHGQSISLTSSATALSYYTFSPRLYTMRPPSKHPFQNEVCWEFEKVICRRKLLNKL